MGWSPPGLLGGGSTVRCRTRRRQRLNLGSSFRGWLGVENLGFHHGTSFGTDETDGTGITHSRYPCCRQCTMSERYWVASKREIFHFDVCLASPRPHRHAIAHKHRQILFQMGRVGVSWKMQLSSQHNYSLLLVEHTASTEALTENDVKLQSFLCWKIAPNHFISWSSKSELLSKRCFHSVSSIDSALK